jgi:CheY-like chemotaxis protein
LRDIVTAVLRSRHLPAPRILVVDDDCFVAHAVRRMFGMWNLDVEVETEPFRVVERIHAGESFDLIMCDLKMPLMSGHEVLAAVRSHFGTRADRPNVILMSGSDEVLDAEDTGDAVLMKPFCATELYALVSRMVDRPVS